MGLRQSVFFVLLLSGFTAVGQLLPKHIRNYGPEITRSGEVASAVAVDDKGFPFFGTEKGVLTFEGDRWRMISIKNEGGVRSLEYDTIRHRLWVGGAATFGYIVCDANRQYRYISLSDSILKIHPFKQVWQILVERGKVTFMSNEAQFEWSESGIVWKDIKSSFIYLINGLKYYSKRKGTLSIEENGALVKIWDQPGIGEPIYYITAQDSVHDLLFTPYDGVFRYNRKQRTVSRFESPLNTYLMDHDFYNACRVNDSLVALGTWYDGVVIANVNGTIVERAGTTTGMISGGISALQLDPYGKLWVATDYGISQIDLKSAMPEKLALTRTPDLYTMQISINNDSTIFWGCVDQPIALDRKPHQLLFRLAAPGFDAKSGKIQVRLEGLDKQWTPIDHFEKEYGQLGNGEFVFRAKWEGQPDSAATPGIPIIIDEPWYQPLIDFWKYIVLFLFFAAIIIFGITYRLRVSKKVLTRLVSEKTKAIEEHKVELVKMNENLRQVNEELDILLYRSSHDLISPVKSVRGLLNLIKISPADQATYIDLMEDRILRLESILTELNSYIKNIKTEPVLTHLYFKELCVDVWREMEFMETAVNLDMQLDIPDDLVFECDRGRMKVIMNNLVGNSIKYSDLSKEKPFVNVSAGYERDYFVIRVSDNGRGIRSEHLTRLFEMFYRASEGANGLGLGLYLVKKIIDSLKGTITIESELNQWTRVEVRLPMAKS
jgi:signal transduction histidine kinase